MLDDATKQLLADVDAVATNPGTESEPRDHRRHHLEVLALFDRCRGLFRAVRMLVENGYGHEALILTRPMYTESLMLLELASVDETRRVELVVGWQLASVADLEGIMREAQSRGDDTSAQIEALARRRASLEGYARRQNARTRHWRPSEKELGDRHLDGDGYLDFRMSHHFVHGSAFASEHRYSWKGDTVIVGNPDASDYAKGAALSASQSILRAVQGMCSVLSLTPPSQVPDLLQRVEQLAADPLPGE